jgi:DNA helicase-2/ATP-dependent DNA helicase PcrA
MIGKRGFIDRQSNVQIVDWRNAPVSRIYYRYEEGDDYEEEIAGRRVEGMVEARRNVSIARGNLRRIGTPHGTYLKDSRGRWVQASAARPGSTAAWARRRAGRAPGAKGKLGIHHGVARADKALPEIAALIDKEQFELITQPGSGIVVIQGGHRQDHGRAAPDRVPNFRTRGSGAAHSFVVPSQRSCATSPACCRPSASRACRS